MKAYRKYDKKMVDVEHVGQTDKTKFYKDKGDGKVYPEDVLEIKEYYGG